MSEPASTETPMVTAWVDTLGTSARRVDASRPVLLSEAHKVWVVVHGYLDVFYVPLEGGDVGGPRRHVTRLEAGEAAFGVSMSDASGFALIAVGSMGGELLEVSRKDLLASSTASAAVMAGWMEQWVARLLAALMPGPPPPGVRTIGSGETSAGEAGQALSGRDVVWLEAPQGTLEYPGGPGCSPTPAAGLTPLSPRSWLACVQATTMRGLTSCEALSMHGWQPLETFHALVCARLAQRHAAERQAAAARLEARQLLNNAAMESALASVLSVTETATRSHRAAAAAGWSDSLLAAVQEVGQAMGIVVQPPPRDGRDEAPIARLRRIAEASHVRLREIRLRPGWWQAEGSPLLGFRTEQAPHPSPLPEGEGTEGTSHNQRDNVLTPCAILPMPNGRHRLFDPAARTSVEINAEVAETLQPQAFVLYRPLPDHQLTWRDLARYMKAGVSTDLRRICLAAAAGALLSLLVPVVMGTIVGEIIPNAERSFLWELTQLLIVATIAKAVFELFRAIALLRLEGRIDAELQAAVWDRLLRLPTAFFRRFTAGDLTMRAMGVDSIRQVLSGVTVNAILGGVFSLVNCALMLYYDIGLTAIGLGMALLFLGLTSWINLRQLRVQGAVYEVQGQVAGLLLQLLNGIARLRVAGVEARAFKVWIEAFAQQRRLLFKGRALANVVTVVDAVVPLLASMALFGYIAAAKDSLPLGTFLAFNAAYGQFLAAVLSMNGALTGSLVVAPLYRRLTPILETLPEVDDIKSDPGALVGSIEINHVSFRYQPDGPLILDEVSIAIAPGQFVAFVGPSGSGKSTLFRLLLGFETPESGTIFYDGKDLSKLDLRAVRRQLGVVIQHAALMPGSIFENIIGSEPLTLDDAWEGARMAGLDQDIDAMPMGMHTMVAEGMGTLSGGQRQRLIIARALVHRPRILLFDEATSALDNRTQEIVSRSLERLHATRVVIAHRLSTIQHADRIYVIVGGRLVQQGSFEELLAVEGPFAALARRQMV